MTRHQRHCAHRDQHEPGEDVPGREVPRPDPDADEDRAPEQQRNEQDEQQDEGTVWFPPTRKGHAVLMLLFDGRFISFAEALALLAAEHGWPVFSSEWL